MSGTDSQRSQWRGLQELEDHPETDRTFRESRGAELQLSEQQREALSRGEALTMPDDALSRLKVFDDADNQLGVTDVEKTEVACLECDGTGIYCLAQMNIPNFGVASLQSFACSNSLCGSTYRRVRMIAPHREDVAELPEGHGRRIRLRVLCEKDLQREVIIADECTIIAGELTLSFRDGTMSTVEGSLRQAVTKLRFMHTVGSEGGNVMDYSTILDRMIDEMVGNLGHGVSFEFIIEDESDSSHIQTFEDDSQVTFETYMIDEEDDSQVDQGHVDPAQVDLAQVDLAQVEQGSSIPDDLGEEKCDHDSNHLDDCTNPSCQGCLTPLDLPPHHHPSDLTTYLNRFAEHIQAQEGTLASSSPNHLHNREQHDLLAHQLLDQMD